MFDIFPTHMVILAIVAIIFIGPKDLPRVMRVVGQWVGRGRAMARHFRGAVDEMIREAELQEMEQKWKAENERIMREHAELTGSVKAALTTATPAAKSDAEAATPEEANAVAAEAAAIPAPTRQQG
jgi:sec-independent protein translocase protein TatB